MTVAGLEGEVPAIPAQTLSPSRARVGGGVLFNLLSVGFAQGSTLLTNIIIARLLGRALFGEYAAAQNTLLVLSSAGQLAAQSTCTKFLAEFRSTDRVRAGKVFGLCGSVAAISAGIVTIALIIAAPLIAGDALHAPQLARGLVLGSGYLFFFAFNGFQLGALAGLEAFRAAARAGAWSAPITFCIMALAAHYFGVSGALIGLSVASGVRCIIHGRFLRRELAIAHIKPVWRGFMSEWPIVGRFAVPAAIAGLCSMPALWAANAILIRQPGGLGQMALYSAAFSLRAAVVFVPAGINAVSMSLLNHDKGRGALHDYWQLFRFNLLATTAISIAAAVMVGLLAPHLMALFGRDFKAGSPVIIVLLATTVPEALASAVYQVVQSQARMWTSLFAIALPQYLSVVCVAALLAPKYGAVGLAIAYGSGWVVNLIMSSVTAWHIRSSLLPQAA